MKPAKAFLCLMLSLTMVTKVVACDCGYNGSFMKVARKVDAVVLVKIVRYKNFQKNYSQTIALAMEAKVIKVYKGKITETTVTIWGDNGAECRPYVSEFAVGDKYIIALSSLSKELTVSDEANYYVSSCGAYRLKVNEQENLVYGDIDSSIRLSSVITLQGFEEKFRRKRI